MLESIWEVQEEIKMLLLTKNQLHRIADIDFTLMECFISFLKPFKDCSDKLSSETEPTIHIYALWYEKLKKIVKLKCMYEMYVMEHVKEKTLNSLEKRFQPTSVHLVGLFLNPPFKELSFLPAEKKIMS